MDWLGKLFKKDRSAQEKGAPAAREAPLSADKEEKPPAAELLKAPATASFLRLPEEKPPAGESPLQVSDTPRSTGSPDEPAASPGTEGASPPTEAVEAETAAETILSVKDVLKKILMTEGVTGAMVVSCDGFLLAHAGHMGDDHEAVGVLASSEVGAAASLSEELQTGRLSQMIVDFSDRRVIMESIGDDLILVLVASRESNLGMLRLVINNVKESIVTSLTHM